MLFYALFEIGDRELSLPELFKQSPDSNQVFELGDRFDNTFRPKRLHNIERQVNVQFPGLI